MDYIAQQYTTLLNSTVGSIVQQYTMCAASLTCEVRPHMSFVYVCGMHLVPRASPHHTFLFKQSPKYTYVHPHTNPNNSTYSYRRVHMFVCTSYQTNVSYLTHQTNKSHSFNTRAREHVPSPAPQQAKALSRRDHNLLEESPIAAVLKEP